MRACSKISPPSARRTPPAANNCRAPPRPPHQHPPPPHVVPGETIGVQFKLGEKVCAKRCVHSRLPCLQSIFLAPLLSRSQYPRLTSFSLFLSLALSVTHLFLSLAHSVTHTLSLSRSLCHTSFSLSLSLSHTKHEHTEQP